MIAFWVLAIVLVVSSIWTITARKPIYSVVSLLLNFAALATLYLMLHAEFLAVIQIIVYSGAILVLFVFVIALLSSGIAPTLLGRDRVSAAPLLASLLALVALVATLVAAAHAPAIAPLAGHGTLGEVGQAGVFGSIADFGHALFLVRLLPFEITALVLMVAVVGVVLLAGDLGPYTATRARAEASRRAMREAIVREGK
ncbi:MAG TPA: NADH-quinone oxidoreductase subunit J [Candidatus Dormibacteraeota bacterium]|nr:NADH-quinone oxidoreductase subunit J [Candidatus Dormibacteraeota bacterium]